MDAATGVEEDSCQPRPVSGDEGELPDYPDDGWVYVHRPEDGGASHADSVYIANVSSIEGSLPLTAQPLNDQTSLAKTRSERAPHSDLTEHEAKSPDALLRGSGLKWHPLAAVVSSLRCLEERGNALGEQEVLCIEDIRAALHWCMQQTSSHTAHSDLNDGLRDSALRAISAHRSQPRNRQPFTASMEDQLTALQNLLAGCNRISSTGLDPSAPALEDDDPHIDDADSAISDTSSGKPLAVQDYFDARQAVFVARERRDEFRADIIEKASAILHRKREGLESDGLPDRAMDEADEMRHRELTQAVADAKHQLFMREIACMEQGFEPEKHRYRRVSSNSKASAAGTEKRVNKMDSRLPDMSDTTGHDQSQRSSIYQSVTEWLQSKTHDQRD